MFGDKRLKVGNWIIQEYRERIQNNKANVAHFMDQLAEAEKHGRLEYQTSYSHKPAGYQPKVEVANRRDTVDGDEGANPEVE